jgi:aryl-alcohol dehydrogenase-like predicted oxidoreductase
MEKRKLGKSGLEVAPLCLGGNVFGWTADERTSFRTLDTYLDNGGNFVDTADVYSRWIPGHEGGESETVLGRWFKQGRKRQQVILATKVGMEMGTSKKGLSKDYIMRAVEDSLRRLQTDYIDLYQAHKDDESIPLEETLEAFAALVKQGKVRAIGASNYSASRLEEALAISEQKGWPRYESLQPEYNLCARAGYESELEQVAQKAGLGVIPYYALAAGFLTGKYRSEKDVEGKARAYRVKDYLNERGFRILATLDEAAQEYRANDAKVALAWLISRPSVTAAIASATSTDQLRDLVDAVQLKLSPETIAKLDEASAPDRAAAAK